MNRFLLVFLLLISGFTSHAQLTVTWAKSLGGTGNDFVQSIYADASGNVYIAGSFNGTVDFDPSASVVNRTSTSTSFKDAFFAKYSSAGALQWVNTLGSATDDDEIYAITADASGNVYVAGYFSGTVDFDPGAGVSSQTSAGNLDLFFGKYTSAGAYSWVNRGGSAVNDYAASIAVDASGNVYVAGAFQQTIDFDFGGSVQNRTSVGDFDMFFGRYSSTGTLAWINAAGSIGDDRARAIATNGTSVWLGASYSGDVDVDPGVTISTAGNLGAEDGLFAAYSATTGSLSSWGTVRSTDSDIVSAIWSDGTSLYTGGSFSGTADVFGNGATGQSRTSNGGTDIFIAKHSLSTFDLIWLTAAGGVGDEGVDWMVGDGSANVYASGYFQQTVDFDAGAGAANLSITGSDITTYDAYVLKYNSGGTFGWAFNIGSAGDEESTTVSVDASANVYTGGIFENTVDVDPGTGTTSLLSNGAWDGFFVKYAPVTPATEPTASPTSFVSSSITTSSYTVSFTAASPAPSGGYIAVRALGSAPTSDPVDGVAYAAGSSLGNGTVAFVGTATTFNESGLAASSQYFYKIYAYAGSGASINYRQTSPLSGSVTTTGSTVEPTASPTLFLSSLVTSTSFTVVFTAATGGPAGYIAVRGTGTAPTSDPVDGVAYTAGTALGNGTVAFVGTGVTFNETGLTAGTQFFYKIYSFNGSGATINYKQSAPLTGTVTTTGTSLAAEPTASPTALVFSNITQNSYDFSFTPAAGTVSGYIGIRRSGAAPTFVPVDGVTYNVADPVGDGTVNFNGTGTSYTQSGATQATSYFITIYAYNGTGASINYRQASPLSNSVTTLSPDNTGPVITDNTVKKTSANTALKVSLTITDPESTVTGATINYYPINSFDNASGDFVNTSGNTWEYTIPASFVTEQGVEYEITATNSASIDSYQNWTQVLVEHTGNGLTIPYNSFGSDVSNYRIISIPLNLEKKSIKDVLADNLGDYDKTKWRVFRYQNGKNTELTGTTSFELGRGYWLIVKNNVSSITTGAGVTTDTGVGKPFKLNLTAGWNQIGNPFNFDVKWDDVITNTDNTSITIGDLRTFDGSFAKGTLLRKFSGGFVMMQSSAAITIPVVKSSRSQPRPTIDFHQTIDNNIWAVELQLKSGGMLNDFGGVGMHPEASIDNDKFDDFTLPRFFEYLELNHPKKLFESPFTKDIVPTTTEYTWEFEVESNLADDVIEIKWDNSQLGNNDKQLVLWDESQQRAIDMRKVSSYSFDRKLAGKFKVLYGPKEYVKEKTKPGFMVFRTVYPVPATTQVTFGFSIAAENQGPASLEVYDQMGKKIGTVLDRSLEAGYHEVIWNIEGSQKPAPGVYISVLKSGGAVAQQKIIIQ